MSVSYNAKSQVFQITTLSTSYLFKVNDFKHLVHLYYGAKLPENGDFSTLFKTYSCPTGNTIMYSSNPPYSMFHTLYEYPFYGKGDMREPALELTHEDGSHLLDLKYQSHEIMEGKKEIPGLPSASGNNATTLIVHLSDEISHIGVDLFYSSFSDSDVITRSVSIINNSQEKLELDKVMSLSFDHFDSDFEAITLVGSWARERHPTNHEISNGVYYIDSKLGVSGADNNPFLCLKKKDCQENYGECYGFSLVYSGNHRFSVEKNSFSSLRVQAGINPFEFKWFLKPGETFSAPEAIMTYSKNGLNKMSQNFHSFVRHHIVRGTFQFQDRPILINNWEATYFDFNATKLLSIVQSAKELGIELFVLDDGWFGHRNDDTSSLGDWFVNTKKIRGGLTRLAKKVNQAGLKFGLWVEPEMISYDSELYKAHPDWVMKHPKYDLAFGRNQAMLDLANPSVVTYLKETLSSLFSSANIEYVKWDCNRNMSDIYSTYLDSETRQGYVHRYYLGYYELLGSLVNKFPNILFEGCASGGNRFDLGQLCYTPQIWCSDDQDPYERWQIQAGTSLLYPPSVIGAHVSANTNHQMFRKTSIETKFNVAAFGLLGYELDLTSLSKIEKTSVKNQIEFYKKWRHLFQYGTFYRTIDPWDNNQCGFEVVSEDGSEAILGNYQALAIPYPEVDKLKVYGLLDQDYEIHNRPQLIDIKTFGTMINYVSPIKLKEDHFLQNTIAKYYEFKTESEDLVINGKQLENWGFFPKHQFTGTGLSDDVRILGDFGSRLYTFKEVKKNA
ncbi:MAG: alpha-galactosidase [Bacilli bacterium]